MFLLEGFRMATTSLHLRLPKGLYKRLQQQAKRNNVSLNTEIVNQLEGQEAAFVERVAEKMRPLVEDILQRTAPGDELIRRLIADVVRVPTEAERLQHLRDLFSGTLLSPSVRRAGMEAIREYQAAEPAKEPPKESEKK
jgi:hypothetical protein